MNAHLSLHGIVRIEVREPQESGGVRWRDVRFVAYDGTIFSMAAIAKDRGGIEVAVAPQVQEREAGSIKYEITDKGERT